MSLSSPRRGGWIAITALFSTFLLLACGAAADGAEGGATADATAEEGMYAVFETSMGTIVCELYYEQTPVTVANFVGLATGQIEFKDAKTGEMVKRPYYDGLTFHRVIKDFMVQGGCPEGTGRGGPGYTFFDEIVPELTHDKPGILSMANAGPSTNGSQFFITHVPTPHLDGKHTIFGHVVAGQDVVDAMAEVEMSASTPVEPIVIEKLSIVRTGEKAETFDAVAAWNDRNRIQQEKEAAAMQALAEKIGFDLDSVQGEEGGLRYAVTQEGDGAKPSSGQTIVAHYTGYLTDGTKFDSSVDRGAPFETPIGVGRVIKGWDDAFLDMNVGEKRVLIIPPELGYGARGAGGVIPPDATLVFDVELLDIKQ